MGKLMRKLRYKAQWLWFWWKHWLARKVVTWAIGEDKRSHMIEMLEIYMTYTDARKVTADFYMWDNIEQDHKLASELRFIFKPKD